MSTRSSPRSTRPRPFSSASPIRPRPDLLQKLAGTYETPTGIKFEVVLKEDGGLYLRFAGQADQKLVPYKGLKFRDKDFSDVTFEFTVEDGTVKALKQIDPSGVTIFPRK